MGGSVIQRLLLLAILLLAACAPSAPRTGALRVVDDAGDTVALAAPARRIVSLIPASTELLFAIGAGDVVVGRSTWCADPPEARRVANLGDGIAPNLEAILGARPDLVILYQSAQNAEVAARLRGLGISALRVRTDSLSDVSRWARLLGALTGRERQADSVAEAFRRGVESVSVPAPARRPTVFLLVWEQPPMTVGRGSFLSELIERAGGENLFADVGSSSAPISIEAVAVRDPDVILTLAAGPAGFAARPEWQVVSAVRERRFVSVRGTEFSYPGPRSPQAIAELARKLAAARR